jgi:adenosylmethionine-8-amino-7-oxononanoate aminotransferase
LREGPDTVAAFIAEPVIGSGGVIVPPEDHFPLVREICDRHQVLFISDEVITGFGRTGQRFGLNHYRVQPDIISFAKGVTSGYLPLGGIQINNRIREAVMNASPQDRWMHAFTYSGHAACCAVGLRNLELIESEQLPERAASVGNYLLRKLESLRELPVVGEVRGQGLMAAVELAGDRETKSPAHLGPAASARLRSLGVIARARGDVLMMAPPLVITEAEIDLLIDRLRTAIESVRAE